jgi:hypothetical protein
MLAVVPERYSAPHKSPMFYASTTYWDWSVVVIHLWNAVEIEIDLLQRRMLSGLEQTTG